MADTDTNIVSLALYRYLCENIVGTENHVKTIRLMNTVRDNMTTTESETTITSGSFGEGLEMRGSDLDVMYVAKSIEVYEDEKPRLNLVNRNFIYYSMQTDDVKPGFTLLLNENIDSDFKLFELYEELDGKYYLSSTICKQLVLRNSVDQKIHGPCVSDKNGDFDNVLCLHCKTWISHASQWISRSNNSWPNYNVKESIIKHGVLFVPIGTKGSPKEDIEWRMSFSVGEKMLINTFTHTQLLCYALLKILLKDVIATYTECLDLLCSYFLKTIIFWISEELPQSVWKPDNLIPCFMRCFDRLIYCVKYSACVHYFIPENNMFENKIEGRTREILLDRLHTLKSYGWLCVLFSDQLSNFHASKLMDRFEPHSLHTNEIAKTFNSKFLFFFNYICEVDLKMGTYDYKRIIHQIVSCDQSSLKYFHTYYMSLWCAKCAQSVELNSSTSINKQQYKHFNFRLCTLLQNIYHDVVSGWLMLASLFYKTKQYSNALRIIVYSLSKCTPEKLCRIMDMSDILDRLQTLQSFQKKSMVRLGKLMLIDLMKFGRNSGLIPNELQMEVENGNCFISTIVYALFLKLLCYYHLHNARQCQDCIHTLQIVIAEHYCFEKDARLHSVAFNILGVALQLLGDNKAASQAFMQSIKIDPDHTYNTSFKRLSLLNPL